MTSDELKTILDTHAAWLRGDADGKRADLSRADLTGANLYGANLTGAYLYGADLTDATNVAGWKVVRA